MQGPRYRVGPGALPPPTKNFSGINEVLLYCEILHLFIRAPPPKQKVSSRSLSVCHKILHTVQAELYPFLCEEPPNDKKTYRYIKLFVYFVC